MGLGNQTAPSSLTHYGENKALDLTGGGSNVGGKAALAVRFGLCALMAASALACVGVDAGDRVGSAWRSVGSSAAEAGAWFASQQRRLTQDVGRMQEGVDAAMSDARGGAEEAARRVRSRAIMASDACYSLDEAEGCAVAAKSACRRESYADGAPLASSSYVVCSGAWSLRAASAPEGVCKTKRRLNAALCW